MANRLWSELSVTDVFCGAGGNTIGAKKAGLRVRVGLNHWDRAIETYGQNNPEVDVVERVDVSLCDPRRYPSTDIGIFSPECTTHSPAGGGRHQRPSKQASIFGDPKLDPATVRSRVTMFDVVRFTEFHRYRLIVVENVVEATRWELFEDWLAMMARLGYAYRILSLSSMFFHPTPQSRDRIYVVFWLKGNPAPNLEYRPLAPCAKHGIVAAVQAWKNGRTVGKYRRQYVYLCQSCNREVTPFYYAALNALDFSLAAERIGDRGRPLKPRTLERIRFGLEKYGRRVLVVNVKQGERDSSRAWPADTRELGSVPTWDNYFGVSQPSPFLVACANGGGVGRRVLGLDETLRTVRAGGGNHALVRPGFLLETAQTHANNDGVRGLERAFPTRGAQQTSALVSAGGVHHAIVQGAPIIVPLHGNARARGADEALPTQLAECSHDVVLSGAQISMRDADAMRVAGLDRELMAQGCAPQQAVMSRSPFLVSYYGTDQASPVDAAVNTITGIDRHALVEPELNVEDCYFRMLQPHEIGAAMAFPTDYIVGGNKRDRVKQYGNAVTPPVMDWIVRQCAATLAPELEQGAA